MKHIEFCMENGMGIKVNMDVVQENHDGEMFKFYIKLDEIERVDKCDCVTLIDLLEMNNIVAITYYTDDEMTEKYFIEWTENSEGRYCNYGQATIIKGNELRLYIVQ